MDVTGVEGDLELACSNAVKWSLRLYNHVPPKPVVTSGTWYDDLSGGTAEMTAHLGYLSLLSGNFGDSYRNQPVGRKNAYGPAWEACRGATYCSICMIASQRWTMGSHY